jgi:hypothetical protein
MDIVAARKIAHAIATPYARRFFLDVDDARQVAWIAAWRAIESHDAARSKITTWIDRCVRLALADWRRNTSEWGDGSPVVGCVRGKFAAVRGLAGEGGRPDRSPPGWVAVDDADAVAAICRRAFGGELLRRRYLCGETVVGIAASMGVHPTRVDQLLREAIAEIRASAG